MTFRATTFSPRELRVQCRLWRRLPATIGRRGNVDAKLLHGTLDMLILKALYPALQRLTNQGRVETTWGTSEKNQRARFYTLTRRGRKQLAREEENWERLSIAVARVRRSV